jgi:hypothetical protein
VTRERWIQIAVAAALLALVAYGSWQRWRMLAVSPFPLGVDGYYYPIQLRSLLETGTLQYPASPLTFWFMMPFAAATDPIIGAKLGAAIGGALVAIPAYGVGAHLAKARGPGLVAAAVATTSASSAYLSMEFIKQGFGLAVALGAIWLVLRAIETASRHRIGVAIGGAFAALLAHKLAVAVVLAIAVPAAFEELRVRGVLRGRRLLYMLVVAGAAALVLVLVGLVAPQRFLSAHDLALVENLFTSDAHWDGPALVRPGLTLTFDHEAAIAGVLGIAAAISLVLRPGAGSGTLRRSERVIAWLFVVLAIGIALPWLDVGDTQGLAFRLRASAFIPLAICASLVAGVLAELVVPVPKESAESTAHRWQRDGLLAVLAVILVVRAPSERTEGRILAHPALVTAVMAAEHRIPKGTTVIVPERHIMFMTAWYTRAPVALRPERVPYGRRVRLLPLHFIEAGSPLDEAIDAARADPLVAEPPIGLHPRHRNGLVLVTEVTWDWLLAAIRPTSARSHWERWRTI